MGTRTEHRDIELQVTDEAVTARCCHCEWRADVTTAPYGVNLVRQARLEAFDHAWQAHAIHAWDLSFAVR